MRYLVSIITPAYNASKFIDECVSSVISQNYKNWEMIIVDDFSTDNTKDIIKSLVKKDKRIRAIFLNRNVGSAEARNRGIGMAKGKYIAFLDADDYWVKSKLNKQILFMQENNIAFSFTTYQPISEDSRELFSIIRAPKQMTYHSYLKNTIIGCLTVIVDIEKTGDFLIPNIRSSQDMALWLLILRRGFTAYGLDENLARYRLVSSSNTSNKWKSALDVWKVYRDIERLSFFYAFWCFLHYFFHAIKKRL